MEVGEPKEFDVQTSGAGGRGDLQVEVTGPARQPVRTKEKDAARGKKFEFTPEEEGKEIKCSLRCFHANRDDSSRVAQPRSNGLFCNTLPLKTFVAISTLMLFSFKSVFFQ